MEDLKPVDFTFNLTGGTAVPTCLASARWFCDLLRTGPPPAALAGPVRRLVASYAVAVEATGPHAPPLLPVREVLLLLVRAVTDDPLPPDEFLVGLPDRVAAADPATITRLGTGSSGVLVAGYAAALDREIALLPVALPVRAAPPHLHPDVYVVHISCETLDATPDRTPEVSAIGVRHHLTGRRWTFATYLAAGARGGGRPGPADQAEVLTEFYRLVVDRPRAVWVHWNMNEGRFGFGAMAQRHRELTGVSPPDVSHDRQFDLAEYLKRAFGGDYVGHPRLPTLMALNEVQGPRFRDLAATGRAWAAGRFAEVADSLTAKVTAIDELYRRLTTGTLRIGSDRVVGPCDADRATRSGAGPARPADRPAAGLAPPAGPAAPRAAAGPQGPFVPLTSWGEILDALNEPLGRTHWKNTEATRDKVRKLNAEFDGPIVFPSGKGRQPYVDRESLLSWWGDLQVLFDRRTAEADLRAEATRLAAGETHTYGRSATVAPEIGGAVKNARKRGRAK